MKSNEIYTIGYQDLSIERFIDIIKQHNIQIIIDIRENPYSRNKHFSKKNLAATLDANGIAYYHFKELGNPTKLRRKVKQDHDYNHFFREYEAYMITQSNTLDKLSNLNNNNIICLVCYESDFKICHRKIVAFNLAKSSSSEIINL